MNGNISEIVENVVKNVLDLQKIDNITLEIAKVLANVVEAKAKEIGVNAVVAVSNNAARPVLVECMDT